jgi:hypothetical protein
MWDRKGYKRCQPLLEGVVSLFGQLLIVFFVALFVDSQQRTPNVLERVTNNCDRQDTLGSVLAAETVMQYSLSRNCDRQAGSACT